MIKAKFDLCKNSTLYSIEVHNPKAFMFGHKIINMEKKEILDLLKRNGYYDFYKEEYEFFDTIFCEEIYSTLVFEFDRLVHIEFSPLHYNQANGYEPLVKDFEKD